MISFNFHLPFTLIRCLNLITVILLPPTIFIWFLNHFILIPLIRIFYLMRHELKYKMSYFPQGFALETPGA